MYGVKPSTCKKVKVISPCGEEKIFPSLTDCYKFLGYKDGGKLKMNKIIKSNNPKRNGYKVIYYKD